MIDTPNKKISIAKIVTLTSGLSLIFVTILSLLGFNFSYSFLVIHLSILTFLTSIYIQLMSQKRKWEKEMIEKNTEKQNVLEENMSLNKKEENEMSLNKMNAHIQSFESIDDGIKHGWDFVDKIGLFHNQPVYLWAVFNNTMWKYHGLFVQEEDLKEDVRLFGRLKYVKSPSSVVDLSSQ